MSDATMIPAAKPTGVALGTGRRKTAVARVRIRAGEGKIEINGRPLDEFFNNEKQRQSTLAPLIKTSARDRVNVWIRVNGGGITGQADACKLGIALRLETLRAGVRAGLAGVQPLDPRQPHERTQALRPPRCPPGNAVLQALIWPQGQGKAVTARGQALTYQAHAVCRPPSPPLQRTAHGVCLLHSGP